MPASLTRRVYQAELWTEKVPRYGRNAVSGLSFSRPFTLNFNKFRKGWLSLDKWLTQRLTEARKKNDRWLDLANDIETLWQLYFDGAFERFTGLRSTWTCATEDLAKQLALLGAAFSIRYPSPSDRRISIAWRRWELQYKDVEEMLRLAFRRNFGLVDCKWIPLFAPDDKPYGAHFEPSSGLVEERKKYIPPRGSI